MTKLQKWIRLLPTMGLSLALAVAVWITAVTSADPSVEQIYPTTIPIEIIGQASDLVLVEPIQQEVTVTVKAPQSEWNNLTNNPRLISAKADFSGLEAGEQTVEIKISLGIRAAQIVSQSPETLTVTLEKSATRTMPITLVRDGEPAIGFQVEDANLAQESATVTGPESLVNKVQEIRAVIDVTDAHETINASIPLTVIDNSESVIENLTVDPIRVNVEQPITQRGGYRSDIVVKPVYQGRLTDGYRLTSVSVFPPAVTVFSTDPSIVNDMPGYVETDPISLDGISDDLETRVALDLPDGVSLVGDQRVLIQIGIAAIDSSLTLPDQTVEIEGLDTGLAAEVTPGVVDLVISGPLPLLNILSSGEVHVYVDATGLEIGTHQVIPQVEVKDDQLQIESILPGTLQIEIYTAPTATPSPVITQ